MSNVCRCDLKQLGYHKLSFQIKTESLQFARSMLDVNPPGKHNSACRLAGQREIHMEAHKLESAM